MWTQAGDLGATSTTSGREAGGVAQTGPFTGLVTHRAWSVGSGEVAGTLDSDQVAIEK
jgi:hypothetical protein